MIVKIMATNTAGRLFCEAFKRALYSLLAITLSLFLVANAGAQQTSFYSTAMAQSLIANGIGLRTSNGPVLVDNQQVFSDNKAKHSITPRFSAVMLNDAVDQSQPGTTISIAPTSFSPWRFIMRGQWFSSTPYSLQAVGDWEQTPPLITDFAAGIGYRVSERFLLGAAFDYENSVDAFGLNWHSLDRQAADSSVGVSLFGSYADRQLLLDSEIGFSKRDYVSLLELKPDTASGDDALLLDTGSPNEDVEHFFIGLGVGYRIDNGPLQFTPSMRLDYMSIRADDYNDQLSNTNFNLDDQQFSSLTSTLGGQFAYPVNQSWGLFVPHFRFEWVHEFEEESRVYKGRLIEQAVATDPSQRTVYSLQSTPAEQDYFNLGLGFSARFSPSSAAFLSYEKVFGKSDVSSYTVTGGVRFEF